MHLLLHPLLLVILVYERRKTNAEDTLVVISGIYINAELI